MDTERDKVKELCKGAEMSKNDTNDPKCDGGSREPEAQEMIQRPAPPQAHPRCV